ncbi:MAG TPA: hypothetical protein VM345_11895 [Acidimicrobiales bacterium]|jgi:hypothetical protein|nr:hypothetical protein [Acidimicrobiales bacterium]
MTFDELFDIDRPPISEPLEYAVTARGGGGWEPFGAALTRLLERCSLEGLWWATIDLEDQRTPAYAHLGPDGANRIWTEVSSEAHLPGFVVTPHQVDALRALGWSDPLDEEGMQNFHRSWDAADLGAGVAHTLLTLVDVYGFTDDDVVRILIEPFETLDN